MSTEQGGKSEAYWQEKFAGVGRRAFEMHVLELVCSLAPLQESACRDTHGREENPVFRRAELVGQYPKTRVKIQMYDQLRDRELSSEYPIWDRDFGTDYEGGKGVRRPDYVAAEMLTWARGG